MYTILRFSLLLFIGGIANTSYSQLDYSNIFLNYKRSLTSNFLNGEFQIGNKDNMHFVTLQAGYNFSGYESLKYCPYYTGTVALDPNFTFSGYSSKKNGIQAGIGYCYYFTNLENEKKMIPFIALDLGWLRNHDQYSISYEHQLNGAKSEIENEAIFHTLSGGMQFGFIYTTKTLYYKISVGTDILLPVNEDKYMATDPYNIHSSTKLPLAGVEPYLQIGIGFKLF